MNSEKYINEKLPKDKAQQFADILHDAIKSYLGNMDSCNVKEWLGNYLSEQIPDKSTEEIIAIRDTIINTIETHEQTIESMNNALNSGKSIEAWFQEETNNGISTGQQAYELVETHSALTEVSNQYSEPDEQQEVIDVKVIPEEEWQDDNWNKYKMKDLVSETVRQAGDMALRTTASDLYEKTMEYGLKTVMTNKELISESVMIGASTGLKVATAGAMEIAESRNIMPPGEIDIESRSLIASMAIENLKTLGKVTRGEIGLAEGLKNIKDTSVATVAAIIKTKVAAVGAKIGTTVGAVFGPVGAVVGNFVGGAVGKMAGTKVGSKIVETAKKIGSAAKSVVSKVSNAVKSVGSKIKSGLGKIFGRW